VSPFNNDLYLIANIQLKGFFNFLPIYFDFDNLIIQDISELKKIIHRRKKINKLFVLLI
jgi:hypothetical protein